MKKTMFLLFVRFVTNMFCEIGICWFLIMYSFLVGSQVAICRSIENTLDPIRFDVTLESFLFGMCCSWMTCHTNCKGIQLVCGHHDCGHWEEFHLKIAFHKSCTQVQNSFFWNMFRFVAIRLAGCHRLTCYNCRIWFWETGKLLPKW